MTKASDLDRDLNQLGRIFREGETVDGTLVQWDDDGELNKIVEALGALDTDALESLTGDVGIDARGTNASAERLCAQIQADGGQNSDADRGPAGAGNIEPTFSEWVHQFNIAVAGTHTVGSVCKSVDLAKFGAHFTIRLVDTGAASLDGVYGFRGVNTFHSVASTSEHAGHLRRLGEDTCPHHGATAREFFPNPEFSLAGQVFGAVCQHLREHVVLKNQVAALSQGGPVVLVLDDEHAKTKSKRAAILSWCSQYPMLGLNQLVAVIDTQDGRGRSNRRHRD